MASEGLWLKWQIFYKHPYTEYLSGTLFSLSQKLNSSKSWMKHVFLKNYCQTYQFHPCAHDFKTWVI